MICTMESETVENMVMSEKNQVYLLYMCVLALFIVSSRLLLFYFNNCLLHTHNTSLFLFT